MLIETMIYWFIQYQEVVKDLEELPDERINKINLKDLPKDNQSLKEGEFLIDELLPLDFEELQCKLQNK